MVEDIESLLPAPSGESALEVSIFNSLRVLGAETIRPVHLPILRLACELTSNAEEVKKMRASFREGVEHILGVFSRVRGETEEVQLLWRTLIERLRVVLERKAKDTKRHSTRTKRGKRLRRHQQ